MEASEYLNTIAQVSVAFVGSSAIVIAIAHRPESQDRLRTDLSLGMTTRWLIERGLFVLLFALLPMLLMHFELTADQAFRISAAFLAVYFLSVVARLYHLIFKIDDGERVSMTSATARLVIVGCMIPVQILAAIGVLPLPITGWYLAGVSWLLFICAALFGAILNRMAI